MDRSALAVLLRATQWSLDDAAFRAGDLSAADCAQLADDLERAARAVRAHGQQQSTALIIEHVDVEQRPRTT